MGRAAGDAGAGILVSVVMPVYNAHPEWLDAAVASVRRQRATFAVELVICDDGSDEPTRTRLADLQAGSRDDPTGLAISVVRHPSHHGRSAARNSAAAVARGHYLVWLDSDDEFPAGALAALVRRAEATGARMVVSRCEVVEQDGGRVVRDPAPYLGLARRHRGTVDDPLARVVFPVPGQLVGAAAFWRAGGFAVGLRCTEVSDFFRRFVLAHGIDAVRLLPVVAYRYHRRPGRHASCPPFAETAGQALQGYWDRAIGTASLSGIEYLGRSGVTGAQHFALSTADGVLTAPRALNSLLRGGGATRLRWAGTAQVGLVLPALTLAVSALLLGFQPVRTPLVLAALLAACAAVAGGPLLRREGFAGSMLGSWLEGHRHAAGVAACLVLTAASLPSVVAAPGSVSATAVAAVVTAGMIGYLSVSPDHRPGGGSHRTARLAGWGVAGVVAGLANATPVLADAPPTALNALRDVAVIVAAGGLLIGLALRRRAPGCLPRPHTLAAQGLWTVAVATMTTMAVRGVVRLAPPGTIVARRLLAPGHWGVQSALATLARRAGLHLLAPQAPVGATLLVMAVGALHVAGAVAGRPHLEPVSREHVSAAAVRAPSAADTVH